MNGIMTQVYETPYGELLLGSYEGKLCLCDWRYRRMRTAIDTRLTKGLNATYREGTASVIELAISQLAEYFSGARKVFDVPLLTVGTDFQKTVWQALIEISFGNVASYKQLSQHIGRPDAVRAVGTANGANAISIFIPCHRIIGRNGELVGYAGGLRAKQKLLALENDLFAHA